MEQIALTSSRRMTEYRGEGRREARLDRWVALLRGVNVGGANKVPMAGLRALAAGFGWTGVRSYIASGNLVFAAPAGGDHAARLRAAMMRAFAIDIPVFLLTAAEFRSALAACPFRPERGKDVHGFFFTGPPVCDKTLYDRLRLPSETLTIQGGVAWLHAPEGIGRSKLAEKLGKVLSGAEMTGRNLNTLRALAEMLDADGRAD